MEHKIKILQSIIDDLMKMPKSDGDKSVEIEIEPKDGAESPMDELLSKGDDMPADEEDAKEPEMEFDDEGPLGGSMRGESVSVSKPSFSKGRRR